MNLSVGHQAKVAVLDLPEEEVILLVHACNGAFSPYRYRWLLSMERLEWVPEGFNAFRDAVLAPSTTDPDERLAAACDAFDLVLSQVDAHFRELGWAQHPGEVWADSHRELGFGYNMDEWKRSHRALRSETPQRD